MASAHSLQGLIKWLNREGWRDRFAETFDADLLPACEQTGLEANAVVSTLGGRLVHEDRLGQRVRGFPDPRL